MADVGKMTPTIDQERQRAKLIRELEVAELQATQQRRKVRTKRTFSEFVDEIFPVIHPTIEYKPAWFHRILCHELYRWNTEPGHPFLMVMMPPRHGKSEYISRLLPPYLFGENIAPRVLGTSYGQDLANKMSRDAQKIMMTDKYNEMYPHSGIKFTGKGQRTIRTVQEFETRNGGEYIGRGVVGSIIGRGADRIIIDDPVKGRKEAESITYRDSLWQTYSGDIRTRLQSGGKMVLLMTRWHQDDLAGRLLSLMESDPESDRWKIISFPAIYDSSLPHLHPDDKRKDGEALWPAEYDEKDLNRRRASMIAYDWFALFQQTPQPPGGAIIKRQWLQVLDEAPPNLYWVRGWDLAVTKKTSADASASVEMAVDQDGNIYIRDFINERDTWPVIHRLIVATSQQEKIPLGFGVGGQEQGFIDGLLADKRLQSVFLKGYRQTENKLTRATPWIPRTEQGKFFLIRGLHLDDVINEMIMFTGNDDCDDFVDAISVAYQLLSEVVQPEWVEVGTFG